MSENSTPSGAASGDLVQYNAPDFGVIPAELMCDQRLSRSARLLGCLLWTYRNKDTGEAFPSQKTLADRMGVSVKSVKNYMAALRKRGWMESQHRISADPTYRGNPGALIHTLHWSITSTDVPQNSQNKGKGEATFPSKGKVRSPTGGSSTSQEHTKRTDQKNININSESISKTEKALLNAGVFPRVAARLIREYPEERILQKLEHFAKGELALAIEENWQPQKGDSSGGAEPCEKCGSDSWVTCTCESTVKTREDFYGERSGAQRVEDFFSKQP